MKIQYKSYIAEVYFSVKTNCFYGEVANIEEGHIIFTTSCRHSIYQALQQAVDQYLLLRGFEQVI